MSRPLVVRPAAEQEAEQIREYLRQSRPSVVPKFEARYVTLLERIASQPYLFAKVWRSVRAVTIPGFRFVVFNVVLRYRIDVICVSHGSRRSALWKSRL